MTSPSARAEIIEMIAQAVGAGARQSRACLIVGLSLRTVQRWKGADMDVDGRTTRVQQPVHSLTTSEREQILGARCQVQQSDIFGARCQVRQSDIFELCLQYLVDSCGLISNNPKE